MKKLLRQTLSALCALVLLLCALPTAHAAADGITKQSGHLESAYVEWTSVPGATRYTVSVKKTADETYTDLDDALIRKYPDHWRADALGLAEGEYVLKVTPYKDDTALTPLVTDPLTVLPHDRSGYAFSDGKTPGAYKDDGTLKSDAQVVYVTDENKNTVQLGSYKGLKNIVSNVGKIGKPVDVRILGKITDLSNHLLEIKTSDANLTIEGVGNDATAYGWGFKLANCSHVELRNLAIMMVSGGDHDGVTVESAQHVWVHNCEFFYNARQEDPEGDKEKGDGSLDTKYSENATYSYNHFWDTGKCNLQGSKPGDSSNYITYHHNWYDHSDSRHPRVRNAYVHVYNNYYDDNDEYGIAATCQSTIFVENNFFQDCDYPMFISMQGSDLTSNGGSSHLSSEDGGMIKAFGNTILNAKTCVPYSENATEFDYYDAKSRDEQVPAAVVAKKGGQTYDNFDTDTGNYIGKKAYKLDAAADVPEIVTAYAGRVEGGDFTFEMDTLTKGNKYPDEGLLAAINNYTCARLSVGGIDPEPVSDPGYTRSGDVLTLTETVPDGQRVWAACWDADGRFLGAKALTTGTSASLNARWSLVKLLRLTDDTLTPQRPAIEISR